MKTFKSLSLSFERNSGLIVFGTSNDAAIWDMNSELVKDVFVGHEGKVQFVGISKDGQFAISCSAELETNLIFWDLQTNQMVAELLGHTDAVACACFSKDGLTAASGSADKTIRTWNLIKAKQKLVFLGHDEAVITITILDSKKC